MVMEEHEIPEVTPFPGVIKILGEGFNTAANNVQLMILPLVLDLFLLFGPKLRVGEYFKPYMESAFSQMQTGITQSAMLQLDTMKEVLMSFLSSINLFGLLHTVPIGVSVLFGASGSQTPLGQAPEFEMSSILMIIPIIGVILLLGIILGTVYYSNAARIAGENTEKTSHAVFGKQLLNTILLYLALVVVIIMFSVPISCLLSITLMVIPLLYQILLLILVICGCWLVIPLFYIPHGIFMKELDFPNAVKESFQMASWSSSVTVRFILFSIVISMGLDMIWAIPQQSSWLILISIFGHAFISTGLLTSSFVLYRELTKWQKENRQFIEWRKANLKFRKAIKKEPENHD